jgi:hypothetical protein
MKAMPKLAAEMEKLAFLLGTWQAADIYEQSTFNPEGGRGAAAYHTVVGPGGLSILTDYEYEAPHGQSNGHQVLAWDPELGCYVGYIVASSFPGCLAVVGSFEGASFVLSGEFEARGSHIAFRQVFSDIADETMVLRQYNAVDGRAAQLFGTTIFTRGEG